MNLPRRARGFTLLEVLVALVIVAFGMGALMATLTTAATSVERLRDKSFAEWVALNRISEVRLGRVAATKGKTNGEVEFGGQRWRWTQNISDASFPNMLRIDLSVSRAVGKADDPAGELAVAEGFIGLAGTLAKNTGQDADWSLDSATRALQQAPGANPPPPGNPPGGTPPGSAPTPSPAPPPAPPPIANPASTR